MGVLRQYKGGENGFLSHTNSNFIQSDKKDCKQFLAKENPFTILVEEQNSGKRG